MLYFDGVEYQGPGFLTTTFLGTKIIQEMKYELHEFQKVHGRRLSNYRQISHGGGGGGIKSLDFALSLNSLEET